MNLLPSDILRKRKLYAELKRLAAVQAVIFLLLILLVWALYLTIRTRETRAEEINIHLQNSRFAESEALARALRDHHARKAAEQSSAYWLELSAFNTKRLDMMYETLPLGVSLIYIDVNERGAVLTGHTEDLSLADIHREAWMSTNLVYRVQLSSATVTETGTVKYVLTLHWTDEN